MAALLVGIGGATLARAADGAETAADREVHARMRLEVHKALKAGPGALSMGFGNPFTPVLLKGPATDRGPDVEQVSCEWGLSFPVFGQGNELGGISAAICLRNAGRIRALAVLGGQSLKDVRAALPRPPTGAEERKLGWYTRHEKLAPASESFFFPLIVVSHGVLTVHTVVVHDAARGRAVLVQASTQPLCGRPDYQDHALCRDVEAALKAIAAGIAEGPGTAQSSSLIR